MAKPIKPGEVVEVHEAQDKMIDIAKLRELLQVATRWCNFGDARRPRTASR
jgi:hypothetical protein